MTSPRAFWILLCVSAALGHANAGPSTPTAPREEPREPVQLLVEPEALTLDVGEKAQISATVKDRDGKVLESVTVVFYSRAMESVGIDPATGVVEAFRSGEHVVVAMVPAFEGRFDHASYNFYDEELLTVDIPVKVPHPPVESLAFTKLPQTFYAGTRVRLETKVIDRTGVERGDVPVRFESRHPDIAAVSDVGELEIRKPGRATIVAKAEATETFTTIDIVADPVASLDLRASGKEGRTGDVIFFEAIVRDAEGHGVPSYPVQLATFSRPDPTIISAGAAAFIDPDGAFVAERAGLHTIIAVAGPHSARATVAIRPRNLGKEVEVVGHGAVRDRHSSDLWVWEAPNGRDYAITGTWGADGHAYFWDVTEPSNIQLVDTVRVDARTVNDVKVSEDGRTAVISREGASDRKNGLVILDVSNPTDGVRIVARYDDQLNGGVHNVFIADNHVYALSNSRRYDIINIEDPQHPYRVGRFELTSKGHSIHDVWVVDGIAYSSNWHDGVVAVDVGGGGRGGAPNHPVMLGSYAHPSGWNHAAFPYRSKSTGKFYVFAGDEAFPYDFDLESSLPIRAAGWIHVIEWDDWNEPREVARFQVPEAGTHNLWVEDDVLYVAYYNGGLRVVDVSGDLRGDLYKQGREIAFWHPYDPEGFIKNAPFAWGPQPYKGHIFVADFNSGLWAVRLVDPEKPRFMGETH
ncbi:MAG TPA: hypothetical protein VEK15_26490 [Vicinamibacteria bacterium]|nr:hypothetical protein [Vicinamibacteria bacterium]